jgi:hypothetical protein
MRKIVSVKAVKVGKATNLLKLLKFSAPFFIGHVILVPNTSVPNGLCAGSRRNQEWPFEGREFSLEVGKYRIV